MSDRPAQLDRCDEAGRAWVERAVALVEADARRSADTHLLVYPLPPEWGVQLYLKDESTHPTGSLKHRLARSLFLHALCSGWIGAGSTVVEASSGSTAVSEAYFARMLGLPFVAVMPASTSPEKIALIEFHGGRCHLVADAGTVYDEARRIATETGGHYLDQFTHAERATDWRGNNNIAESVFEQLAAEEHPVPDWVVVGAGTGGTSATIGRYLRYRRLPTRLAVVDPEGSAFFPAGATATPRRPAGPPASRGSAAPGSSPRSCPRSSTACSACPTPPRSPRCATSRPSWAAAPAARPVRTCGGPSSWWPRWWRPGGGGASSRCCATAASGTPTPTTPMPGWPTRAWTSHPTGGPSSGSRSVVTGLTRGRSDGRTLPTSNVDHQCVCGPRARNPRPPAEVR